MRLRGAPPILVAALLVSNAAGQIHNLSTDENGFRLYFSSRLCQRESGQFDTPKLFVIDPSGLRLAAQRERIELLGSRFNDYQFVSRDLSADGSVSATNTQAECIGGSACLFFEYRYTTIETAGKTLRFGGHGQVSRNGRHAITWGSTGLSADPSLPPNSVNRVDLTSGRRVALGRQPADTGHWIASDGTVLVSSNGQWRAVRLNGEQSLQPVQQARVAVLADDGSFVVYETKTEPRQIRLLTVDGGSDRALSPAELDAWGPSLSSDGSRVLFLGATGSQPQAFLVFRAGGEPRQVTFEDGGVTEAVLNGNGGVAFVVTGRGRVLGVDVGTGFRSEYLGPAPDVSADRPMLAPGSAYEIRGAHLTSAQELASPPLPESLAGLRVRLGDRLALIHFVTPETIRFQVPWDLPLNDETTARIRVTLEPDEGPWEAVVAEGVAPVAPAAVEVGRSASNQPLYAVHEDWLSLVTGENPARPGETVHMYATGLGAVDPPVRSGVTAPAAPLSRLASHCQWAAYDNGVARPIEVPFVGLAPELIGYYQLEVRVPVDWTLADFGPFCMDTPVAYLPFIPVAPRP